MKLCIVYKTVIGNGNMIMQDVFKVMFKVLWIIN